MFENTNLEEWGRSGPMADPRQKSNYLDERDVLAGAGAILRGETRKIVTIKHLQALEQLVRTAEAYFRDADDPSVNWRDWLREASKVLR